MATIVLAAIGAYLAYRLVAFTGAAFFGAIAWGGVIFMALGQLVGEPFPTSFLVAIAVMWTISQVFSRVRRGSWRSRLLRSILPI